jgi:ABC-2 type transport system permease protein
MRYFKLYFYYLSLAIKSRLVYKVDALIGIFGFITNNAINFIILNLILSPITALGGWSTTQVIFLYAITLIPKGIDHITTDAIWNIGTGMIVRGELDKYLVTPVNPLFQIIAEFFQVDGLGEVILGIVIAIIMIPVLNINWTVANVVGLIICMFFSIFIYTSIKLITATFSFWMKMSIQIMNITYMCSDFARYPLTIFNNALKFILTFIVPFALTSYFPVKALINNENIWLPVLYLAIASPTLLFLAYRFWSFGLSKYESAGN